MDHTEGSIDPERRPVAVVTAGAGAGLGGTIVRRLHADGLRVIASDAHAGRLEKLRGELGIETERVDVSDRKALAAHLAGVEKRHGRIDLLVNCAGTNVLRPTWQISDEEWDTIVEVNLNAAFRAARAVLPGMIDRGVGSIISIASIAAWKPGRDEVAYGTTKAALVGFTRSLAMEVAGMGVRVNAVAPGFVENPFLEKTYGVERMNELRAASPMGRGVLPSEVASAVAWLASDEASYVTGEIITVAGGQHIRG